MGITLYNEDRNARRFSLQVCYRAGTNLRMTGWKPFVAHTIYFNIKEIIQILSFLK